MKSPLRASLLVVIVGGSSLLAWQTQSFLFQRRSSSAPFHNEHSESSNLSKAEFTFSRLRFSAMNLDYGGYGYRRGLGWSEDFPKADRQFSEGVHRLTRLDIRPVEEVLDLDSDEIFDWPFLYAVNVGTWDFTDEQAKRLRDYLHRGGFLLADNFHGAADWERFIVAMRKVLPDAKVDDLTDRDEIFHVLYDLNDRFQIPGYQYIYTRRTYEKDGIEPEWRAIRDDKGRVMVAICHNMHLGDAWEHADDPRYPERFSSLAYRLGINYIIYAMTH
jgi:uncharacterized protein DUF4159